MIIKLKIDNRETEVKEVDTILQVAKNMDIKIPTLCHNDKLTPYGGCRICLVEVAQQQQPERTRLLPACASLVEDGLIVMTNSARVLEARRFVIELLLARCPEAEELIEMAAEFGISPSDRSSVDRVGDYLLFMAPQPDDTRCIRCGLCVRVCAEITERHAISFSGRGMDRKVLSPFAKVANTCIGCGACAYVCPTNTITIEEAAKTG